VREVTFYATVAQVLPVLALALLLERRFFERPSNERTSVSLFLLSTLTILVGGEVVAVTAVLSGGSPVAEAVVMAALTLALMGLFVPVFARQFAVVARASPRWLRKVARGVSFLLVLAVPAAILVKGEGQVIVPTIILLAWMVGLGAAIIVSEIEDRTVNDDKSGEGRT
jgi:hypothetical protein